MQLEEISPDCRAGEARIQAPSGKVAVLGGTRL
jgi:hypothetical protein